MITNWSDELLTGIKEIDSYNMEFFRKLNLLLEASKKGKGRDEIVNMLDFMNDYVNVYLDIEEKYMNKYAYIQHLQHSAIHTIFKKSFNALKKQFQEEGLRSSHTLQFIHMLINWLISHITKLDKEFFNHIRLMKQKY